MTRVVAYVDGFNLYFGLKAKGWKKHYWLDLNGLATSLLKPGQTLAGVHYFTSRIRPNGRNVADVQRQSDYLDALATLPSLTIHYGHYLQKSRRCHSCGATWMDYEEKMTDVNIAMQLLTDAFDNHFDAALLISADSDLTTPVRQMRARFPAKRVILAQPPGRNSVQLAKAATAPSPSAKPRCAKASCLLR
ncbi:NYN domain-containing protein [Verminephrobacter eiseniae]|uniref:NYN domain-containing protein n=1 Tax=Verminephrobacter eiseniae TaxID=364317 RepID=UPI0022374DCA|nr:NYN domain-containing protein [Verminephrobacter eiseniae]